MSSPGLSTDGQVEVTEGDLRAATFIELDTKARKIEEKLKSTWVELGALCIEMRNGSYWKEGGFHSFHSWLQSALPCCRSWAYMAMNAYEELRDVPEEELKQMPLSNAEILKTLPKSRRNDPEILQVAKSRPPREFRPHVIAAVPDTHLETIAEMKFKFTKSQAQAVLAFLEAWRLLHPDDTYTDEDVLEESAADWMLAHQDEIMKAKDGLRDHRQGV